VLASIDSQPPWLWAACGKHPVSGDFLAVGRDFPLVKGFGDWIENGYQSLSEKRSPGYAPRSWRFWARGGGKGLLVCGVVKDSSDSLGRPYPLLILGTGVLKKWERRWDLLPIACERTWDRIEYIAAQKPSDIKMFERELESIKPPRPDWSESSDRMGRIREQLEGSTGGTTSRSMTGLQGESSEFAERQERFASLGAIPFDERFPMICLWHSEFKSKGQAVPSAAFMGGTFERTCLAFFARPLIRDDFIRLWAPESSG
jgi:type VI secretion system protein VasJ